MEKLPGGRCRCVSSTDTHEYSHYSVWMSETRPIQWCRCWHYVCTGCPYNNVNPNRWQLWFCRNCRSLLLSWQHYHHCWFQARVYQTLFCVWRILAKLWINRPRTREFIEPHSAAVCGRILLVSDVNGLNGFDVESGAWLFLKDEYTTDAPENGRDRFDWYHRCSNIECCV